MNPPRVQITLDPLICDIIIFMNKPRYKRSPIWTQINDNEFINLFNTSESLTEIMNIFGRKMCGASYLTLKARCIDLGLDYKSKAEEGIRTSRRKCLVTNKTPDSDLFCESSIVDRGTIKRRIINNNLIQYKCSICSLDPYWNNKALVLILDHINGVRNDHRLENLRFVCPNCNAQLDTFGSKNKNNMGLFV